MRVLLSILLLVSLAISLGCRAAECRQMASCCDVVAEMEIQGLGGACADLATSTRDPQNCRDISRTVRYMLEDRDQPVPEACQQ